MRKGELLSAVKKSDGRVRLSKMKEEGKGFVPWEARERWAVGDMSASGPKEARRRVMLPCASMSRRAGWPGIVR